MKYSNLEEVALRDPETVAYETTVEELEKKIRLLDLEIKELEATRAEAEEIGLNTETGAINIANLIKVTSKEDEEEIKQESPQTTVSEAVEAGVIESLNDKTIVLPAKEKTTGLQRVRRKVRNILLGLFVVANFGANTSFMPKKSMEARAYDSIEVKDLKAWEQLKLFQDEINKLNNIRIINEANKNSNKMYLIVDKSVGLAHLYQGDNLISTYEVGTGQRTGDDQTKTIVADKKVYWDKGNKQTGAGIYTVNKRGKYEGSTSFTMLNEREIEVPTAFHKAPSVRNIFFNNRNIADNRMSNGCFNFQARSLDDLGRQKGFGKGTRVYVLPDNPHNKFQIVDGELRFISNEQNVNRTIRPYEAKPIILKAENVNDHGKEFLQTISKVKVELMGLYPTVSNDVYNQLAKIAYGIFGQESSFGTYGGARGQYGKITDLVGAILGKNVSAGVTQIRITSINPKIKEAFDIKTTEDLFDDKKAGVATMSLLLDIYTTNIPDDQKPNFIYLTAFYYNNPQGSKKTMGTNEKSDSVYVKKVLGYTERVTVYCQVPN
ncbi:hypothetical protein A2814_00230 [Candidatus Nomurabacteria bacterium RIFCSPHIGHO2_01_FULL_38_19]|uniref:Uncharacterized protein n=1 Tax=Candidatus Nomurabacteria bacterium RIFCSPHIGHO2_01_FULL_38_19 TaxID=1801732 RepID=A0A1F6UQU5_9BACT|nr:MAG: hypothetical protein A2814_00230 [Candidatus Nomurabacteria bacterium RIFCSPHIGHO2_01_FULL_38_19]